MIGKQTRLAVLSTALVFLLSAFTAITVPNPVYADYTPTNGQCNGADTLTTNSQGQQMCQEATSGGAGSGAAAQQAEGTTCAVEKVGWILCPVIEGAAKVSDYAFTYLADNLLSIEPELLTSENPNGGTLAAWGEARNLANIMFVIAFIIIVYSQITGSGLNNYGIKRMLPRLILAAIAVNISYYICQAIVDLSNILGYNIMQALQDISNKIGPQIMTVNPNQAMNTQTTSDGGVLALITVTILASAAFVWFFLPVLGSIVLTIGIICATVIIILLLRKAFIVLLVVISPLAFVMYLLPNTEKYFSKWLSMFWKLLLVFPIVALLMGGGQLASTIILVSGAQSDPIPCDTAAPAPNASQSQTSGYGRGECTFPIDTPDGVRHSGMALGLVAAGVAVAPLLAVWSVLQGALAAAGAIGGKIGGAIQKGAARSGSGLSKAGKSGFDKTAFGRGLALRRQGKEAYKNERFLQGLGDPSEAKGFEKARRRYTRTAASGVAGVLPGQLQTGSIKAQQAQIQRAASAGAGLVDKREKDEIQNEMAALSRSEAPLEAAMTRLADAIKNDDKVGAKAAQNLLMSSGGKGMEKFAEALEKAESSGEHKVKLDGSLGTALKQNALQNHTGAMKEKYAAVNSWAGGSESLTNINSGAAGNPMAGLNDEQIAKQTDTSLASGLREGWITPETADRIVSSSVGENLSQNARASLATHAAPLQQQRAAQAQSSQSDTARAIGEEVARSINNNNQRPPGT